MIRCENGMTPEDFKFHKCIWSRNIMSDTLHSAPLLSTPAEHLFEDGHLSRAASAGKRQRSDEQIYSTYEIERTIAEIKKGKWSRVALQFPDEMLPDASKIFEFLQTGLRRSLSKEPYRHTSSKRNSVESVEPPEDDFQDQPEVRPYILADTSYGACCVDEIASEHVGADVVVHYGRSCLSPTARLPVIYVFTEQTLEMDFVIRAFLEIYLKRDCKVILMADLPYSSYLRCIDDRLRLIGYMHIFLTTVIRDPSSALPNRTVPLEVEADPSKLNQWELFHIGDPPEALLLTLSSRVSRIHIYPTADHSPDSPRSPITVSTARALSRRYALLTSVSTVPIFGILINTLSVRHYIHIVEHVKSQILAAGKKSYTFVVGKINAAKVANFSEIGAWVVIGCWESSLVESKEFWKPVLTPFELELALKRDNERVWTGDWRSNFQEILDAAEISRTGQEMNDSGSEAGQEENVEPGSINLAKIVEDQDTEIDSEESAPPEFDLRTGRYVSHSRPMQPSLTATNRVNLKDDQSKNANNTLIKRAKGDLAVVGGEASPGAEFLRSKRTWNGLGSDFEIALEHSDQSGGAVVEEGKGGIARGYVDGEGALRT